MNEWENEVHYLEAKLDEALSRCYDLETQLADLTDRVRDLESLTERAQDPSYPSPW